MSTDTFHIRSASTEDAAALLEIFQYYVLRTAVSLEWETPNVSEFQTRILDIQKKYPYLVAERDGEILGYAYAHAFVGRRGYDWSAELTIYLAPQERGKGLGSALYAALENALLRMGICNLYACIAWADQEDDYLTHASPAFHTRMGFHQVGLFRRCARKFDRWYDMIWMEKVIGNHAETIAPVEAFSEELLED